MVLINVITYYRVRLPVTCPAQSTPVTMCQSTIGLATCV